MEERLRTIEKYIFAMKGAVVRINTPDTPFRLTLMQKAYLIAAKWKSTLS